MAEQAFDHGYFDGETEVPGEGKDRAKGWDEERLGDLFARSLDRSLQLNDPWGKHTGLPMDQRAEKLFLCTPEQKRELMADCHVSPIMRTQVSVFFQAVANTLEQVSGDIMQSMVEVNDEGFGRALVYSGRTVLVADSFRGGFPFPFAKYDKALVYGVSCIREGLQNRERFMELQRSPFS
ncbi:DUF269 domain-containing protein [Paenibacillus sp. M1]|uniref:DUF269 domain-containing protein n=1 Tax=Paenibacillus haidiansis TaxID=1574488 RepID=A0ABU7VNU4_9BACL